MAPVDKIMFYSIPVDFPKTDFDIDYKLINSSDYARQWKNLAKSKAVGMADEIKKIAARMGLNDYLTYKLVESYVNGKFPQADDSSKLSAIHFFLANLGYDARIAMTTGGAPLLLLPCKQMIYARNYMMLKNDKYYVFTPESFDINRLQSEGILTCALPGDTDLGKKFDLVIGELSIPRNPKSYEFSYGPLTLKGEVNENLMPILYRYPQMPIEDYALSTPDPQTRKELLKQVREQLGNLEGDKAVSELLGFMHNAFEYSTDGDFHGFEKPYFVEETLYYPKNDCEDRSIFYTYLLWNALGRESQLISFPGHEAATVRLDKPVEGVSYDYGGERYFISDPTYIGACTGQVMPSYRNTPPEVDHTFRKR